MTDIDNLSTSHLPAHHPRADSGDVRTWWQQQQDREQQAREARRAADPAHQNRLRVQALAATLLDRMEGVLDGLAPKRTAAEDRPLVAARRQIARLLGAPRFCSRNTCRRTKVCCGEPKHCLAAALPLLPPELIARLALGSRKTRRGRALAPACRQQSK